MMSRRVAPEARRMPISRVRSVTVASMMFMIPMPPTSRLMAAIEIRTMFHTMAVLLRFEQLPRHDHLDIVHVRVADVDDPPDEIRIAQARARCCAEVT